MLHADLTVAVPSIASARPARQSGFFVARDTRLYFGAFSRRDEDPSMLLVPATAATCSP